MFENYMLKLLQVTANSHQQEPGDSVGDWICSGSWVRIGGA